MTLPLNPKDTAHGLKDAFERLLCLTQLASHLDFHGSKDSYALPNHIGCDFPDSPATHIGEAFGSAMERARILQDNNIGIAADNLTRPAHTGVDAKQPFLGRQGGKDFSDAF